MQAFEYEALDASGTLKKGIVSADSARSARRDLKLRNLSPTAIKAAKGTRLAQNSITKNKQKIRKISHTDRTLVTRQLSTLVAAGSPIEQAISTIARQAEKTAVRDVLMAVRNEVLEGKSLAAALKSQHKSFDTLYISLVDAGENAGSLPQVLERLADHMERTEQIRGKIMTAMIYPAALAFVATAVVIGLMTFVVPKVVDQFQSLGQELPGLTLFMISVSDFIRDYGWIVGMLTAVSITAFVIGLRYRVFRKRVDHILLQLPFVGKLIKEMNAAGFARTLSTLTASGVPVVAGLEAAFKTVGNTILQDAIKAITNQVKEGKSLSVAMRQSGVFPPMLIYMVASGEQSGTLANLLEKSAIYLESSFERVTNAALSLLEPAIIILMGGIVAVIVLAILMPILQLNNLAAL